MNPYRLFRSADGGTLIQHPDCPDAITDGNTLSEALDRMRAVETIKGLDHIADQLKTELMYLRVN